MATLIVIGGPTASGKTNLAVRLAQQLNTQIISADSRQCYRELNIGVAKPTTEEMSGIKHYFIDSHSIQEDINVGTFEQYALEAAKNIFKNNEYAILVGGTGLYIQALCNGIDYMPAIPKEVRAALQLQYQMNGIEWLQNEVKKKDPPFWLVAEQQNPHRLLRALEVILTTGQSILTFRSDIKSDRPFNINKFAIDMPRPELYERIHQRVDQMIQIGLVEEVKSLSSFKHYNALQTVGYKEIFNYLEGKQKLEDAIEDIKKNTRHYAKRQVTWFKKDQEYLWIDNQAIDTILASISIKAS